MLVEQMNKLQINCNYIVLQVIDPTKRLGCEELGGYGPLKEHPFFKGIDWEGVEKQKPPELLPYLPPGKGTDQGYWSQYKVSSEWGKTMD